MSEIDGLTALILGAFGLLALVLLRQIFPGRPAPLPTATPARSGDPASRSEADVASPGAGPAHTRGTVMVVDDSRLVRTKLTLLLESNGFKVITAEDGELALQAIDNGASFDLLITDLDMPKLDGFGLIAAVTGSIRTEDIPIIAITGHENLEARLHDCQGVFGFFQKPWNDRLLLKRVETLIRH